MGLQMDFHVSHCFLMTLSLEPEGTVLYWLWTSTKETQTTTKTKTFLGIPSKSHDLECLPSDKDVSHLSARLRRKDSADILGQWESSGLSWSPPVIKGPFHTGCLVSRRVSHHIQQSAYWSVVWTRTISLNSVVSQAGIREHVQINIEQNMSVGLFMYLACILWRFHADGCPQHLHSAPSWFHTVHSNSQLPDVALLSGSRNEEPWCHSGIIQP